MEPVILFEDDHLVVVDKPAGMIVYPDGRHDYPALSHWLEARYGEGGFFFVHRIDRETSGVLAVAKTEETFGFLKEQFKNRETKKTYRAFVHGTFKEERGIIDKPIGSSRGGAAPRSAKLSYGVQHDAVTMYKVLKDRPHNGGNAGPGHVRGGVPQDRAHAPDPRPLRLRRAAHHLRQALRDGASRASGL